MLNRYTWPTWAPINIFHLQAVEKEEEEALPCTPLIEYITENTPCILSIVDILYLDMATSIGCIGGEDGRGHAPPTFAKYLQEKIEIL